MSCIVRTVARAIVTGLQGNYEKYTANCFVLSRLREFHYSTTSSTITNGDSNNNGGKKIEVVPEEVKCDPDSLPQQEQQQQQQQQIKPLQILGMCRALGSSMWPGFRVELFSVVSGLPKDFSSSTFRKGSFGDDAYFIARNQTADVVGVADGVGGWRSYGLDPGEFSFSLMKSCERLVEVGWFLPSKPGRLLATGYNRIQETNHVQGSSTACVVALSREDATLYCANLGDSGFVVVRGGKVVHRSEEQTHCFNTPFQLSCPPPGENVLCDSPDSADVTQMAVEDGDVILLATDGVFDNLPMPILLSELIKIQNEKDPVRLQNAANSIALMARTLAFDSKYMSPFAKSAQRNGINVIGGKPDDIVVVLSKVVFS